MKKDEIYFAFNPQMASLILDIDLELPGFLFGLKKRRIIQSIFNYYKRGAKTVSVPVLLHLVLVFLRRPALY